MAISVEVRLERMDGKLEKHIGITETILKNQESTLGEIRDIVKEHSNKFISHEEVELMEIASMAKASDEVDEKLFGFERRIDKKLAWIGTVVLGSIASVFGLIEILPLINKGG